MVGGEEISEAKSFTQTDMAWALREGIKQGIGNALTLIEAGATAAYVREHLLETLSDDPAKP